MPDIASRAVALAASLPLATSFASEPREMMRSPYGLTAVEGLSVGHHTLEEKPTGCTVILAEDGAVASVDVRGGGPATRETDLLDPSAMVQEVHAIVLTGGSAYGLDVAGGVMQFLEERAVGFGIGGGVVPIVPAAALFDLPIADMFHLRPGPDCGYRAAAAAGPGPVAEGNVGAGAGATVGKLRGSQRGMKGGLGTASIRLPDGLVVAALAAVNPLGDVVDPETGRVVAGVRTEDGRALADARTLLRSGAPLEPARPGHNTVLGVVATNAALSQAQARKMAQMAQDGLARAIFPSHTPFDGDTVFALATGRHESAPNLTVIGGLAAEVLSAAIVRGALEARGIPGYPAARDLRER
jgi:L-aminopeptidase/D-esterase-like protein